VFCGDEILQINSHPKPLMFLVGIFSSLFFDFSRLPFLPGGKNTRNLEGEQNKPNTHRQKKKQD